MSKFELQSKTAIITGGAGAIGSHVALEFARAGANVVIADREQAGFDKVIDDIKALGAGSLAVAVDVTVPEQVDNMVKQAVDSFGRVDILMNCAGGGSAMREPTEIPFEEWNRIVNLNLTGTYLTCIAAGKQMIEQQSGKIINVASTAATKGNPFMLHYSAAKAGVISLSNNLSFMWAKHNINVNCIVPGLVATALMRQYNAVPPDTDKDGNPVPRLDLPPEPEEVADLARFLASEASDSITGEVIPIRRWCKMDRFWE